MSVTTASTISSTSSSSSSSSSSSMFLTLDLNNSKIKKTLSREILRKTSRKVPITKVRIECKSGDFWVGMGASLSDTDLLQVFQQIGRAFPFLQEVQMKVFELPLPVNALAALLRLTKDTLQVIDMADVILRGSQEELEGLATSFQGHPALETIQLDWCQPLSGSLEAVFSKLSTIQTLTQLKICGSVLSVASLRVLCSKQSLQRLSLLDDDFADDGITALAEALETNEHIRELSVRLCGLDISTGERFANVLRVNDSLEKLEVRIKDCDWSAYGSAFCNALKANNTLSEFVIFIDGNDTQVNEVAQQLTGALQEHPSLKTVRIALRGAGTNGHPEVIEKAFVGPLRIMLETNTILEDLQVDGLEASSGGLPSDIQFLLRANRAGRGKLLQDTMNHKLWLQTLIANQDDVRFTHYLLSMNPTLCPVPPFDPTIIFV